MRRQVRGTFNILGTNVSESLASSGRWHPVAKWTSLPVGRIAPGSSSANTESITFPRACLSSWLPHFWARCCGVMGRAAFQEAEAVSRTPSSLPPSLFCPRGGRVKFGKNKVHSCFPFIPGSELLSSVPLHLTPSEFPDQLLSWALPRSNTGLLLGFSLQACLALTQSYAPSPDLHQELK